MRTDYSAKGPLPRHHPCEKERPGDIEARMKQDRTRDAPAAAPQEAKEQRWEEGTEPRWVVFTEKVRQREEPSSEGDAMVPDEAASDRSVREQAAELGL